MSGCTIDVVRLGKMVNGKWLIVNGKWLMENRTSHVVNRTLPIHLVSTNQPSEF
jgi:hypothetical protein